mgnify:CR=1 FL=1
MIEIFILAKGLDKIGFFPLSFEMAFVLTLQSIYNRISTKKDPIIFNRIKLYTTE